MPAARLTPPAVAAVILLCLQFGSTPARAENPAGGGGVPPSVPATPSAPAESGPGVGQPTRQQLGSAPTTAPALKAAPPNRPPLVVKQGEYFRWAMPEGWKSSETTNGVTITAPDESASASAALLIGAFGRGITPKDFVNGMVGQLPGVTDARITTVRDLPDQPSGAPGLNWKIQEVEMTAKTGGREYKTVFTCGIVESFGWYSAVVLGYTATPKKFEEVKLWLPAIAQSVTVTNPRKVAMQDKVLLPRNDPLDDSALRESWRRKGLSEDRISKARREGTMGYERVKDEQTGTYFEMPLESYDSTMGGYRNPTRPEEILAPTEPGE